MIGILFGCMAMLTVVFGCTCVVALIETIIYERRKRQREDEFYRRLP